MELTEKQIQNIIKILESSDPYEGAKMANQVLQELGYQERFVCELQDSDKGWGNKEYKIKLKERKDF